MVELVERGRADLLTRAGRMLARGLPWDLVWRGPVRDLEAIEEAYEAERERMNPSRGDEE